MAEQRQTVNVFAHTSDIHGERSAAFYLEAYLDEHPEHRVAAMAGTNEELVVVFEPVPEERPIVLPPQCLLGGAP